MAEHSFRDSLLSIATSILLAKRQKHHFLAVIYLDYLVARQSLLFKKIGSTDPRTSVCSQVRASVCLMYIYDEKNMKCDVLPSEKRGQDAKGGLSPLWFNQSGPLCVLLTTTQPPSRKRRPILPR